MAKKTDKQLLNEWEAYRRSLMTSTAVDPGMSRADIEKHRAYLEARPPEWIRFFFEEFISAGFAKFHIKAIHRIIDNPEWYEVLSWSRELAKSTTVMFAVLFLVLTGRKRNILLVSNSYDNAVRLLEPYRAQLDSNQRIKVYYGEQTTPGAWEAGEFKTRNEAAFRAIGAGQSPRGTRSGAVRPDVILVDDFDTDESVKNPAAINKMWDWFEKALYPTRSISRPLLTVFCGNIIARDCCVVRAGERADHWDIVNIRDKHGKSTWPEKNTEAYIDRTLSKISTKAAEGEYFNNPLSEGTVFKEMRWGKVPPLSKFKFVVNYGDPAPSNSKNDKGSYKSVFTVGWCEGVYYVIKGFLDHVTNAEFVSWYYALEEDFGSRTQVYNYIENNTLQDPFYEQVFLPLFSESARTRGFIGITPDTRPKPDKFSRIEGNLEPLNRLGRLVLNEAERDNPHMRRLEEQFLLVDPGMKAPADGPDCIEGGVWIVTQKITALEAGSYTIGAKAVNSKRF